MRLTFRPEIKKLIDFIRGELEENQDLYLIGGALRDALLDQPIHDLDFAMGANPTALAKRIARRLKADFFVLDDARHTARVLFRTSEGVRMPLDFVQFTGGSLMEDLQNRDFSINAMAISIRDFTPLIDPLNGRRDLVAGILRPCSRHALLDDPVRVLRGIRLALQFRFDFAEGLLSQMQAASGFLTNTSYERQRDEFFKILEGPNPGEGMRYCRQIKVFDSLIPPLLEQADIPASAPHNLPLFDHTIAAVDAYAQLVDRIQGGDAANRIAPWWVSVAAAQLSPFSSEMKSFFSEEVTPGRSKRGLAFLGTLLHDIGKPLTMKLGDDDRLHYRGHAQVGADLAWDSARRLRLSNAEAGWIKTMVSQHMNLLPLINAQGPLTRKNIYRFFKETEDVGIAIALLSLADTAATFGEELSQKTWQMAVSVTRSLFAAWWKNQDTYVSPPCLLDGNHLQEEFNLKPGKQLGELLESLREAQAVGEVRDLTEAKAFIRSKLSQTGKG